MSLYIKNGNFYSQNSDKIVKVELGNQKQIATLKKYEKMQDEGVLLSSISAEATIAFDFQCLCGQYMGIELRCNIDDVDDYGNIEGVIFTGSKNTHTCYRCKQVYRVKEKLQGMSIVLLTEEEKKGMKIC